MNYFNIDELHGVFNSMAHKRVSNTDVTKGAYVVNQGQRTVLQTAGIVPGVYPATTTVPLHVLGTNEVINASYYGSQRAGSGRSPEYRMGRFIDRIDVGDILVIGTDGREIFVCKIDPSGESEEDATGAYERTATSVNEQIDIDELISRAMEATPQPETRTTSTTTYRRDPAVVAFVRRRSNYRCEMPGCNYEGFIKSDLERYIETHHIVSLSDGGEDTIFNTTALCPNCHKRTHYEQNRAVLVDILREAVQQANDNTGIVI